MKYRATEIAKALISLVNIDVGDVMTNLKLQKLLYYSQGFHLALYGEPLFGESIMAWRYGPVVPGVYHHYKQYGASGIPLEPTTILPDEGTMALLRQVYRNYGQFSALKLMQMTHDEPPWRDTKGGHSISRMVLREYFTSICGLS